MASILLKSASLNVINFHGYTQNNFRCGFVVPGVYNSFRFIWSNRLGMEFYDFSLQEHHRFLTIQARRPLRPC